MCGVVCAVCAVCGAESVNVDDWPGFRCTDDSTWTCRTANLTQFLGGFRFVAQEVPFCGWKLAYVPQLPPDFFVSCNPDFIPTNILLPRSVLQRINGTPRTCVRRVRCVR